MVLLFQDVDITYSKTDKEINYGMDKVFVLVVMLYNLCTSFSRSKGI